MLLNTFEKCEKISYSVPNTYLAPSFQEQLLLGVGRGANGADTASN
jgi:hypothetical protein